MSKKNASLAALSSVAVPEPSTTPQPEARTAPVAPPRPMANDSKATKRLLVYMPPAVHKQLRQLAFDEGPDTSMSALFLQGIDLVFQRHGLKSIAELTGKTE